MLYESVMNSPLGQILLTEVDEKLTGVSFVDFKFPILKPVSPLLQEAVAQLEAYFAGRLTKFDLPLAPHGTPFQLKVWRELREIPYGNVISYQDLAVRCGNPKACRAVGQANNRNPIAIIVPCHRVIGKNGNLVGYAGGLNIKQYLLDLEKGN